MTDEAKTPETEPAEERVPEWWEDPNLPWEHKPTKAELWCYGALTFYGLWSMVMMPLRAWLLTVPEFSVILNGSRTALTAVGAKTRVGEHSLHMGIMFVGIATLSGIKWDWIYWWAGRLWGKAFVDSVGGKSGRAKAFSLKLEGLAMKYPLIAVFCSYLPIPFTPVIYVVLGMGGMKLPKFMALNFVAAGLFYILFFILGYQIGAPAVQALEVYSKYAMYISLVLLVVVFYLTWRRMSTQQSTKG